MLYPVAIEIGDEDHAYSAAVPDLNGCFSAGDSLEEVVINVKEAIQFYLEDLAEQEELPPKPNTLEHWLASNGFDGWTWLLVDVDIEPFMGKASKINVSLPNLLTRKIDNKVEAEKSKYKSRSHFLQIAAMNELNQRSHR